METVLSGSSSTGYAYTVIRKPNVDDIDKSYSRDINENRNVIVQRYLVRVEKYVAYDVT